MAAITGFGGEEGEKFRQEMQELLPILRAGFPREVPEIHDSGAEGDGGGEPVNGQSGEVA